MKFAADKEFKGDKFNAISLGQGQVNNVLILCADEQVAKQLVFGMINAVYHDKPWIFWGCVSGEAHLPSSGSEFKLLNTFKFIKAVSDTVFYMRYAAYYVKPLISIGATFREKLVSHHQALNGVDSCLLISRAGSKAVA